MPMKRTDREIESYLRKLEWAGIEFDRRQCRKNDLQPTTAVGSDVQASAAIIAPISSPERVACSPNKAAAMGRIDLLNRFGLRTKRSAATRNRTASLSTVNVSAGRHGKSVKEKRDQTP
jgi:hypothetical protein